MAVHRNIPISAEEVIDELTKKKKLCTLNYNCSFEIKYIKYRICFVIHYFNVHISRFKMSFSDPFSSYKNDVYVIDDSNF